MYRIESLDMDKIRRLEMKNLGLKAYVVSMYKSRFQIEGFFNPKIEEDWKITGKTKEHIVDIYFEFTQMNNLEKTIIKIIEDTEVTDSDVWEFASILKDLPFFAKGILYYNGYAGSEAKEVAKRANIELKKFNLYSERLKYIVDSLKILFPNEDVIGDPFWTIMEISQDNGENTGTYEKINNSILLFSSKKQASNYCSKRKGSFKVFGISQNHLKILVSLQEKGLCPDFIIACPEFEQTQDNQLICYQISKEEFKKLYLRGNNNE